MGVHGLATLVRKNSSLGRTVTMPDPAEQDWVPLIVDGSAFMFHVGLDDALRGGNYDQLQETVESYIDYWKGCGLEPEFVFDGPSGSEKQETVLGRAQQSLDRVTRYMNDLNEAQLQLPHEIKKAAKLPLLSQSACLQALRNRYVPFHFAEGEADSPTAWLASERSGYVMSNDSDFHIFDGQHRGYIPMQSVVYGPANDAHVGWQALNAPATMTFTVHHSRDLAQLLRIPRDRLPLLAALIGNDLVDYMSLFAQDGRRRYPGQVFVPDDYNRIASVVRRLDTNMSFDDGIRACIEWLAPPHLASTTRDEIASALAAGALSYELVPLDRVSPTFILNPVPGEPPYRALCRQRLREAAQLGRFNQFVLNLLMHKRVVSSAAVEMTHRQSTSVYICRPIRAWIYALLDEAVGLDTSSIVEFVRRGTVLRAERVDVSTVQDLSEGRLGLSIDSDKPTLLLPTLVRIRVLTTAFRAAPIGQIPNLPVRWLFGLALSWVQKTTNHPWSDEEILAATICTIALTSNRSLIWLLNEEPDPPLHKPHIQLSAEIVQSMFYVQLLVETLLLTDVLPPFHWAFEGKLFHKLLVSKLGFDGIMRELYESDQDDVWEIFETVTGKSSNDIRAGR
ncbi:hypothetical protein ACM66B_004724 [Microbotryomycetes sp. NB124-2]